MLRIFLDANVLFSASNQSSPIAELVYLILERHELVTSDLALEEARRNIQAKRPHGMDTFIQLSKKVTIVSTRIIELPVPMVEKDAPILTSAIQSKCNYLATGDKKHFGHLYNQVIEGLEVVSIVRMAEIVFDLD